MKKVVCEMCNSSDFVKQDGLFVCQHCGMKYTAEEIRKTMIEGTVDIQGTVRIDRTDELEKLYLAARNARETSDDQSAIRHYENISARDPNSWEALFYLVILKTNSIKNSAIGSSAISVSNCLPKVFELIDTTIADEGKKKEAVQEVIEQCLETAEWLTGASHSFYKSLTQGNGLMAITGLFGAISSAGSTLTALSEDTERCVAIANIMCYCGNYIESQFNMEDPDYRNFAIWSWKQMLAFHEDYRQVHSTQTLFDEESVLRFQKKIFYYEDQQMRSVHAASGAPTPYQQLFTLTVNRNQTALTTNTNKLNRLVCTLNTGEQFELGLGQTVTLRVRPGTYRISFDFWGQGLVPAKCRATPDFVVDGNIFVELTPDSVWGGFKTKIIK